MMGENEKLRDWMRRFIESIERILKIRLQKLRETGESEQEIFISYKYLNKMHLNVIHSFEKEEFPFAEMLYDF
jgi:hypothetical protein